MTQNEGSTISLVSSSPCISEDDKSIVVSAIFSKSPALSTLLTDECRPREISFEPVSKDTLRLDCEPEPEYEFPADLGLEQFSLAKSKLAYKALLSGLEDSCTLDMFEQKQYEPQNYREPTAPPRNFNAILKDWTK